MVFILIEYQLIDTNDIKTSQILNIYLGSSS